MTNTLKIKQPKNYRADGSPDNFSIRLSHNASEADRQAAAVAWEDITLQWHARLKTSIAERGRAYGKFFRTDSQTKTVVRKKSIAAK